MKNGINDDRGMTDNSKKGALSSLPDTACSTRVPKNGDIYQRGKRLVLLTNQGETVWLNAAAEHSIRDAGSEGDKFLCNAEDISITFLSL